MQDKLNTSYQQERKNEQDTFTYFLSGQSDMKIKVFHNQERERQLYLLLLLMQL